MRSHTLTDAAIREIGLALKKLAAYPPRPPRSWFRRAPRQGTSAWRGVVVGIDMNHWGGGRKLLAVQALRSMPLGYGGDVVMVDGWFDSMITCGQEILCIRVRNVDGDIPDQPAYVAMPQFAVDQHYLVEPDPAYIAVVAEAAYPVIQNPCPTQEP